jgi:hypothetical protein
MTSDRRIPPAARSGYFAKDLARHRTYATYFCTCIDHKLWRQGVGVQKVGVVRIP